MRIDGTAVLSFKPHLRPEVVPGEAVYLVSERGTTSLRGDGLEILVPLLDGTRTYAEIVAAGGTVPPDRMARLLDRLARAGLLAGRDDAGPRADVLAFWELMGLDTEKAGAATAAARVRAAAVGSGDPAELADALRAAGLSVAAPADEATLADLTLVHCDDYLDPAMQQWHQRSITDGRPWLPIRVSGHRTWIGPVFRPGAACWRCLAEQMRHQQSAQTYLRQALGRSVTPPKSAPAPLRSAAVQAAALEAVKWLGGLRHPGQDAIWSLDPRTMTTRHHRVRRRPQCPSCGDPGLVARRVKAPVVPRSRLKADQDSAGVRALTPAEVMQRYGHLIDPVTGVVREIARDPRDPGFLQCFHAGYNPVVATHSADAVRAGLRRHTSGKGATEEHARVSALCEAIERHSGFFQGDEPRERATYREVATDAVHPDALQLVHPRQFPDRHRWNAENANAHRIPEPFDDDILVDWTPVWSLTAGAHRLVPTSLLYYGTPPESGSRHCVASSNGAAAGASLEDAILQGFFELVERDAVAIWWYNRIQQPAVCLDSPGAEWITATRERHQQLHRELWCLDLTSDLGIPVFAALSRRTDKPHEDITLGFGAHFEPMVALRRAVAEVNQMLPPVIGATADGTGYGSDDPAARRWWATATKAGDAYLAPAPGPPATRLGPGQNRRTPDLCDDISTAEEIVRRHGTEILILDQTRLDFELPVVKVLVPGLRPIAARFGPGRLYDAPVAQGRLHTATRYQDLNPIPIPL